MSKKYFDVISCENDRKDANYSLKIKWNVEEIAKCKCANGFIVQRVELNDETNIIHNYSGPYFEAWEVEGGCTQYADYDDEFLNGMGCVTHIVAENSVGVKGKIEYYAKVYWVDSQSSIYKHIKQWKSSVSMANKLPSVLEKDCDLFEQQEVITERYFCHEVDFQDEKLKLYGGTEMAE